MFFGRDKYESFQDSIPFKHMLIRLLQTAMTPSQEDTMLGSFAEDALRLLKIQVSFQRGNYPVIRTAIANILESMPPEGTPPYVPESEPVFLLRSADPIGAVIAQNWVETATKLGVSALRIKSAAEQVERMKDYHEETKPADL